MATSHPATFTYTVDPSPKVRMTRRDTWATAKVRPAVQRWRAFAARVKVLGITVQDGDEITFAVPMPPSWGKKKRAAHLGTPHRAKPDLDNLLGGLFDATMPDGDQHIAELGSVRKVWDTLGHITITRKNSPGKP
jgi:Holliday junction resolvase RusA-like endonuclease